MKTKRMEVEEKGLKLSITEEENESLSGANGNTRSGSKGEGEKDEVRCEVFHCQEESRFV